MAPKRNCAIKKPANREKVRSNSKIEKTKKIETTKKIEKSAEIETTKKIEKSAEIESVKPSIVNQTLLNDDENNTSPTVYNDLLDQLDLALTPFECVYFAKKSETIRSFDRYCPEKLDFTKLDPCRDPRDAVKSTYVSQDQKLDSFIYGESNKYDRKRRDIGDHLQVISESYNIPGFLAVETKNYVILAHTTRLGEFTHPNIHFSTQVAFRLAVVDKRTREVKKRCGHEFINTIGHDNFGPFLGPLWKFNGLFGKTAPITSEGVEMYPGGEDIEKVMMCAALIDKTPCKLKMDTISLYSPLYHPETSIAGSCY